MEKQLSATEGTYFMDKVFKLIFSCILFLREGDGKVAVRCALHTRARPACHRRPHCSTLMWSDVGITDK